MHDTLVTPLNSIESSPFCVVTVHPCAPKALFVSQRKVNRLCHHLPCEYKHCRHARASSLLGRLCERPFSFQKAEMASCLAISKLGLRIVEIVFALIAFAAAASLTNIYNYTDPYVRFMVFTGVMAFLISIFYSIVCCVEGLKRTFSGLIEVVINTLWVLFWLAAAAAFAARSPCKIHDAQFKLNKCDVYLASQAFGWLSWFLWIASLLIAIVDMRNGEGLTGGAKRYPGPSIGMTGV